MSDPLPLRARFAASRDTIARSEAITQEHTTEGATLDSTFFQLAQLPKMESSTCPQFPPSQVTVVNLDAFTAARNIMRENSDARGKTSVLNLASDIYRAGDWINSLTKTQEEALCYSSTLYATLKEEWYPWANTGDGSDAGIYSPGIVIFKDDLDHACVDLQVSDRRVVSIITVAAPRHPWLTEDELEFEDPSVLEDLRKKILLVYRMAVHHGQHYLVLGTLSNIFPFATEG
ncbi:hypothetical protein DXG03_003610 [Asterophora parasitica]|uniref:Microbial-type PARG catalytic domain-containing protein n=1 Tax=Asterophora parasitica TaxID=117018 RepID=A0A9P7G341_9AGAR|nr:hypothetical protein DXG03_003610 [Asterophora parasitica]